MYEELVDWDLHNLIIDSKWGLVNIVYQVSVSLPWTKIHPNAIYCGLQGRDTVKK